MKRSEESEGQLALDARAIKDKIQTLVDSIYHDFGQDANLAIVGIQTRGAHLARRIAALLEAKVGHPIPIGILDITLYRDDVHTIAEQPDVKETDIPFDIDQRPLVLIDDVLFTGRTVRSAMNALIDYGRPRCIRLAVLVDRGHRELPIGADYIGAMLATERKDIIDVNLTEVDGEDSVRMR